MILYNAKEVTPEMRVEHDLPPAFTWSIMCRAEEADLYRIDRMKAKTEAFQEYLDGTGKLWTHRYRFTESGPYDHWLFLTSHEEVLLLKLTMCDT